METVSFVFQETFLLSDTIYENIAIGNQGVSKEEVVNAAKSAQIHDFILSLPEGYDTILGEGGIKLSGGEKQRICIARAILKTAPIIVFDEATSFTDIENEYKIQRALGSLLSGKTTIMIAHRLHTIVHADKIFVFDKGKIVEQGTHSELVSQGGYYEHMWQVYTQAREKAVHA
jgi:ATP-binding cassette subfamily B protein